MLKQSAIIFGLIYLFAFFTGCTFTERLRMQKRYNYTNLVWGKSISKTSVNDTSGTSTAVTPPSKDPDIDTSVQSTQVVPAEQEVDSSSTAKVTSSNQQPEEDETVQQPRDKGKSLKATSSPDQPDQKSIQSLKELLPPIQMLPSGGIAKSAPSSGPFSFFDDSMVLLIVLSILLPPLAVYLYFDAVTDEFWVSLLLTVFGFWVLGIIFALLVVTGNMKF